MWTIRGGGGNSLGKVYRCKKSLLPPGVWVYILLTVSFPQSIIFCCLRNAIFKRLECPKSKKFPGLRPWTLFGLFPNASKTSALINKKVWKVWPFLGRSSVRTWKIQVQVQVHGPNFPQVQNRHTPRSPSTHLIRKVNLSVKLMTMTEKW